MGAGTIIAAGKQAWEVGNAAYAGWRFYEKWQMGTVVIHTPKNNKSIPPGGVDFEGAHKDAKGKYWLIAVRGDQYWPKCRVNLKPDGSWKEWVGIGDQPGPRESIVGLFWVGDFADSMLDAIWNRNKQLKKWESIALRPSRKDMLLVQSAVLEIQKP